jgi:hypothetical protein
MHAGLWGLDSGTVLGLSLCHFLGLYLFWYFILLHMFRMMFGIYMSMQTDIYFSQLHMKCYKLFLRLAQALITGDFVYVFQL